MLKNHQQIWNDCVTPASIKPEFSIISQVTSEILSNSFVKNQNMIPSFKTHSNVFEQREMEWSTNTH